ncbi:hypothetical protein CLV92_10924 [Kineococcus xinjiangensis]|uniref:Uncharacterized protein n=1 Tax=Kineococcus xinjiangensis TaxID=512762 RepID=A0A2S6IHS3_9ACTN|nr:hypothetical protein [Kineococcus xinjiangensis]PPK93748.1 hypothetical protein CLV92_10924 [Kineococcus xinjiangensis]
MRDQDEIEEVVVAAAGGARTAYAHIDPLGGAPRFKRIHDPGITVSG